MQDAAQGGEIASDVNGSRNFVDVNTKLVLTVVNQNLSAH